MLSTPCADKIYRCSSKMCLGPLKEDQGALFLEIDAENKKIGGPGYEVCVDFLF